MKSNLSIRVFSIAACMLILASARAQVAPQYSSWAQSFGVGDYATWSGGAGEPGNGGPVTSDLYGSGTDDVAGVAPMPDGGVVVAGHLDLPEMGSFHTGSNAVATLVRYGPNGAIIWMESLRIDSGPDPDTTGRPVTTISRVLTDAQGNIFIAGNKNNNGIVLPFVAKFNNSGALVWQNGIQRTIYLVPSDSGTQEVPGNPNTAFDMKLTSDGGVIIATFEAYPVVAPNNPPRQLPAVAVFDANGGLSLYRVFDFQGNAGAYAVSQSAKTPSRYLVLSNAADASAPGITALVMEGTAIVAQRTFNDPYPAGEQPYNALATADGGFILYSQFFYQYASGAIVRKVNADLTPVWERVITLNTGFGVYFGPTITATADGGYLLTARYQTKSDRGDVNGDSSQDDAFLINLNGNGKIEAVHQVGGLLEEGYVEKNAPIQSPNAIFATQTTDGGYAVATATYSYRTGAQFPDWWTAKMDPYGRVQGFRDAMFTLPPSYFHQTFPESDNTVPSTNGGPLGDYPPFFDRAEPGTFPAFRIDDLKQKTGINAPNVMVQAATFTGGDQPAITYFDAYSDTYQLHRLWAFYAIGAPGVSSLKVQYSTTPLIESSWADLPGTTEMSLVPPTSDVWVLHTTQPVTDTTASDVYFFRAIAKTAGKFDQVSYPSQSHRIDPGNPNEQPPQVTLSAPTSVVLGQDATLTATATDSDDGVAFVTLLDNGAPIARLNMPSVGNDYHLVTRTLSVGHHVIEAIATDSGGLETYSNAVSLDVRPTIGTVYRFTGSGDWSSASNWTPNGVPGSSDVANLGSSTVTLSQDVTVLALSMEGGSISGPGALTILKSMVMSGGELVRLTTMVDAGAVFEFIGSADKGVSGTITNYGSVLISGDGNINGTGSSPNAQGSRTFGRINAPNGFWDYLWSIFNHGRVQTRRSTAAAKGSSSPPRQTNVQYIENHASLVSKDGGGILANDGATLRPTSSADAPAPPVGIVQISGEMDLGSENGLEQGVVVSDVTINGGVLTGSSVIHGNLTVNGGTVSPGHSAGTIHVTGDYAQANDATLILEVGGDAPAQNDRLIVDGTAAFGGTLNVQPVSSSFVPDKNMIFNPITYSAHSGNFSSVSPNASLILGDSGALVSVDPDKAAPQKGQPLNIATRLAIQGGDNVLIAGFIVTGPSGSTKKVLIRGMGPSLTNLGVAGAISDPLLELHEPDGTVVVNDNWQQGDTSQIPNGFAPSDSRESVIVATLTPGSYSALVKGAHGETGVGLAEVYDLESASTAKLANVATRGLVQTGDNVLIGGFIIGGTEPAKVIVRAIGPSLAAFGIPNPLPATTLELHDANGSAIANEGWRNTQESEIIATTIPPTSDDEAAIVATLAPGTYTAVVRGKNDTTGIAVIEAYNLQ